VSEAAAVVHVVDDDDSFRTALARLLRSAGYAVKAYRSAGDFLLDRPGDGPGCLILDLRMPGPSGLELQEALAREELALPVVFLTGHAEVRESVRAMRHGAVDFLTKPVQRKELLAAVDEALARQSAQAGAATRRREVAGRFATLTPREREVLDLVVAGRMNKQIAAALGRSERTVKAHRARIMEKMQVDSVAELVHAESQLRTRGSRSRPAG
jgi:RNA polymerase sigma factor (sigma-70 family)